MRAVIVGAGIAGLAAALRLGQLGWEPVVLERAPRLRDGGYAVTFSGSGYDAAERMGLLPALTERHMTNDEIVYRDARHKDVRMSRRAQDAMLGPRSLNLMRGDIEHALHDALDGEVEIRYSTTVSGVEQDASGVRMTLNDGSVEHADLLIGADGLHSAVRRLVFGDETRFRLDLDHVIAVYDIGRAPGGLAPRTSVSYNVPGRQVGILRVDEERTIAFFAYRSQRPTEELTAGARTTLAKVYGDLEWHVPELLDRMPDDDSVYFDSVSQIRMDSWSKGRVVVLGDAAWCVTLFAGYGSALAVAGAELLGNKMERFDVAAALRSWESELRPEVDKTQRAGRRAKQLFVPSDPVRLWLRQTSMRVAASPLMTKLMERRHAA